MKQLLLSLIFFYIISDAFAQPSTGGTQKMEQMYVDQISYQNNSDRKEMPDGPLIYYSNTMILIPFYKYDPKTGVMTTTYDTIDISGVNTGGSTFTAIINRCRNNPPPRPDIDCDSLKKLCKGSLNIFWGSVFSVLNQFGEQKISGGSVKKIRETNKSSSLLVTHGWIWDCKTNKWRLQLFVQVMKQKGSKESSVSFYDDSEVSRCDEKDELNKKKRDRKK